MTLKVSRKQNDFADKNVIYMTSPYISRVGTAENRVNSLDTRVKLRKRKKLFLAIRKKV